MSRFSSALAAAACIALLAGPALAQTPPGGAPGKGGAMGNMDMKGMKAKPMPMAKKHHKMMAAKRTCMDYAWESQDQKDCEAGKKGPPTGR